MNKLCAFCEHFDWEGIGYRYYSEETGGDITGGADCKKKHFLEEQPSDNEEMRMLFLKAETCDDYLPPNVKLRGSPASGRVPLERRVRRAYTTRSTDHRTK